MLETLLQFHKFLPAGLLIAAALLEGFVLSRQARDSEPAVLWLLFCTAVAATVSAILSFAFYAVKLDPAGLSAGGWAVGIAALASAAWVFKRLCRNRSLLLLRELFFDPDDPRAAPRRKPWQGFLLTGYRVTLGLGVLCGLAALIPHGQTDAVPAGPGGPAAVAGQSEPTITPAEAAPAPVAQSAPGAGESPAGEAPALVDPTRGEIPSEDASAMAAMAVSAAMTEGAPELSGAEAEAPPADKAPMVPVVAVPPARPVSRNSLYFSKIRPILSKHCLSCHGSRKQKGELRLDSPDFIRAGVNGKQVIVPGAPEKSRVFHVTGLPLDDTDRMPPKGNGLGVSERELLAEWIRTGADLGDGVSIPAGHDGVFLVDAIAENLPEPDPVIVEDLKKDHVVIRTLSKNGRVLELDFSHSDRARGDLKLSQLGPVALNIYALDFSRTAITDTDLGQLLPMKNLSRLLLSRTGITDAGLAVLKNNSNLEQLNLYSTAVTDAGLDTLASLKSLKKVYLWQSRATVEGARRLQDQVPGLTVSIGQ